MPKKIIFESSVYHLLVNAKNMVTENVEIQKNWLIFLDSLQFKAIGKRLLHVDWEFNNKSGTVQLDFTDAIYYKRGDGIDPVQIISQNNKIFTSNASLLYSTFKGVLNE